MNRILTQKYRQSLAKIVKLIASSISSVNDLQDINNALYSLYHTKSFTELAETIARRFITMSNTVDAKTWREAAKGGSKNSEFYRLLMQNISGNLNATIEQKVTENAHYIKTLPLNVAEQVTQYVKTEAYKGLRASEISKELQNRVTGYSKARADLIARTEASKAMTALTQARAKDTGVNWYQWRTADDARVRNSHKHMEGVLINWDDPPSPEALKGERSVGRYNAGNIYNCRCYPSPLVTFARVKWPAKVYYQGSIQTMSQKQFESIM